VLDPAVRDVAHRRPFDAQGRAVAPFAYNVGHLDVPDEFASSSRRQSFSQNVLQDVFVETQVGNKLFQLSILVLKRLQASQLANAETTVHLLPTVKRLLRDPYSRMTSATGVPVSACFGAKAIWSSVYLDFFVSSDLPEGFSRPENSRSNWAERQEGRHARNGPRRLRQDLQCRGRRLEPMTTKHCIRCAQSEKRRHVGPCPPVS